MPEFPGQVRHSNASYPVIDLTDDSNTQFNQSGKSPVKGMGVFSNISNRTSVTSRYRTKGYLAVVGSTPYVYTSASTLDGDWGTEGNWAGLSATNGLPSGGLEHNALVKLSDSDYDAGWTGDPEFSTMSLKKTNHPVLDFSSSQSGATADGTVLGRIQSNGVKSTGSSAAAVGPRIDFTQVGAAGSSSVGGKIEFYTSSSSGGQELALKINEEKTTIFASQTSAPTAHKGGIYYNTSNDNFYIGLNA